MTSLSEIIAQAIPFITYQLNDEYGQYDIETHLKWFRDDVLFPENVMPEILKRWAIDDEKIVIILTNHHDTMTFALEFDSLKELENMLKSEYYIVNLYIAYVVPIIKGVVKSFRIFDENNREIIKEWFDDPYSQERFDTFRIEWE